MFRTIIALVLASLFTACVEPAPMANPTPDAGPNPAWTLDPVTPPGLFVPSNFWVTEQFEGGFYCSGLGLQLGTIAEIRDACRIRFPNQGGFQFQCTASDGYVDSIGGEYPGEYPSGLVSRPICVTPGL